MSRIFLIIFVILFSANGSFAQSTSDISSNNPDKNSNEEKEEAASASRLREMTFERMTAIALRIDPDATIAENVIQLTVEDVPITVVANPGANRMRAFSPFRTLDGVDGKTLYRMMQANFDSALDARYAIARGQVISAFIHPFSELQPEQFISGLGQVVNLVLTFGTAYTSGALTYGGGDSRGLHERLIEELLEKGREI